MLVTCHCAGKVWRSQRQLRGVLPCTRGACSRAGPFASVGAQRACFSESWNLDATVNGRPLFPARQFRRCFSADQPLRTDFGPSSERLERNRPAWRQRQALRGHDSSEQGRARSQCMAGAAPMSHAVSLLCTELSATSSRALSACGKTPQSGKREAGHPSRRLMTRGAPACGAAGATARAAVTTTPLAPAFSLWSFHDCFWRR